MKMSDKILSKLPPYTLILVTGLVVCWLTLVPRPLPETDIKLFPHADKVAHFILFGAFAAAVFIDLWRSSGRSGKSIAIVAVVSAIIFGGVVELLQGVMALGRSGDVWDFVADAVGACVAGIICATYTRKHPCLGSCTGDGDLDTIHDIYMDSFPPEERRPWNDILHKLDTVGSPFSLTLILLKGKASGFITSWDFGDFVYIEHFAMQSSGRGSGIGAKALRRFCRQARKPVFLEVEPPSVGQMAQRRIKFYERNGFVPFYDFKYVQPPYAEGLPEVELVLMGTSSEVSLEEVKNKLHTEVYGKI